MDTTITAPLSPTAQRLQAARDFLIAHAEDYDTACADFEWPRFTHFNFALDWIDEIARDPERGARPALVIVEQDGRVTHRSYAELSARSSQVASWLRSIGAERGDRMILMLGNRVELWELMLAGIKLGLVLIPTTVQMGPRDLRDRVERGEADWAVAAEADAAKFAEVAGDYRLIQLDGTPAAGAFSYAGADTATERFTPDAPTAADETLLLYFTSGTTSQPKLVEHSHTSYPVGHLSTLYWLGLRPGDVHLNVASPGWAKHAWSNFFTPWIAEATVFLYNYASFDAAALMRQMDAHGVTSFCAPPTVWRMLIQADLSQLATPPRNCLSAGEPLNAEVIDQVQHAWNRQIRDGFGQTESTLQVANTPGQPITAGAMGRPLPGFDVVLVDPATGQESDEGELCLRLEPRPVGLLTAYHGDAERTAAAFGGGYYHTGDLARRERSGIIVYVGRDDDVFKSSDYRISPFELESVLVEHPAVAEAAVVPSPDPVRLTVPKAFVVLADGYGESRELAGEILTFCAERLAPFKKIRRLEFTALPKTISGKIRRVELRQAEQDRDAAGRVESDGRVEYTVEEFTGGRAGR